MKRTLVAVVVCVVAALPAGAHGGGSAEHRTALLSPPPNTDSRPMWTPDGTRLIFNSIRLDGLASVSVDGSDERVLLQGDIYATPSPDGQWIAYKTPYPSAGSWIVRADGSDERPMAKWGYPVWAPDSYRIALVADGLWVVNRDGGGLVQLAPADAAYPSWSPDGEWIVFESRVPNVSDWRHTDLMIVSSSGGEPARVLVEDAGPSVRPSWSPDGTLIAFGRSGVHVVRPDGSEHRVLGDSIFVSDYSPPWFAWMPDSRRIVLASSLRGIEILDLVSGETHRVTGWLPRGGGLLPPTPNSPVPSPDGSQIAFAGYTCLKRQGIFVVGVDGRGLRQLTNDCSIVGTSGPDVLRGTIWQDIILGLGGNDRIHAATWLDVDEVYGGAGNDVLVGTRGADDYLHGGPGNDELQGDSERDQMLGGPGRDRLYGGPGGDWIYSHDGERDVVVCGDGGWGRDRVWADRRDVVARDCEIVHRPKR